MIKSVLEERRVAVCKEAPYYAQVPPYAPSERYPEWPNLRIGSEDNPAYRAMRRLFYHLQLDLENYETEAWNPLATLIAPGETVLLKPNLVAHRNLGEKEFGLTDTDSLVTHGSVIRVVLDYAAKALQGRGKIIIGDCPIQGADWERLLALLGLDPIRDYFHATFPGIELDIKDYRLGRAILQGSSVVQRVVDESALGDYYEIDLGKQSELLPLMGRRYEFGVSQYAKWRMRAAHTPDTNKYLIHKDFLHADVLINLPKMKSHMKAGMTGAMKNLVGLVGHKDYLPHFRFGSPKHGGDEYPDGNLLWNLMWFFHHKEWEQEKGPLKRVFSLAARAISFLVRVTGDGEDAKRSFGGGSWHGNDTVWRTLLDINRAFFYFDRNQEKVTPALASIKYMAIMDGLVGGEKESPLAPTPVESGVMLAAYNPLALDTVATAMMGLDVGKIKQIVGGFALQLLPLVGFRLQDVEVCGEIQARNIGDIYRQRAYKPFTPSRGFRGFVEHRAGNHSGVVVQPQPRAQRRHSSRPSMGGKRLR